MKKLILSGLIAVAVISTSCRKERTCECKTTETTIISGFGARTEVDYSSNKTVVAKQKKNEFRNLTNCYSTRESRVENRGSGINAHTDVITTEKTCELK